VWNRPLLLFIAAGLVVASCSDGAASSSTSVSTSTVAVTSVLAGWAEGLVVDDSGTFAFDAERYQLLADTSPVVTPFGEFPAISLSGDLAAHGSSPIANGVTIAVLPAGEGPVSEVVGRWYPDDGVCPESPTAILVETLFGPAQGVRFERCGASGDVVRAVVAIDIPNRDVVVVVAMRGAFSTDDLVLLVPEFMRVRFP